MTQPLLKEDAHGSAHGGSIDQNDFVAMDYRSQSSDHYDGTSRGKSFTEIVDNITNKLSISMRAEEFDEGNDELQPLRTQSVA